MYLQENKSQEKQHGSLIHNIPCEPPNRQPCLTQLLRTTENNYKESFFLTWVLFLYLWVDLWRGWVALSSPVSGLAGYAILHT